MVHKVGLVAAIRCGGKILRETFENGESIVKLPFGSEYEILIKNVETRRALINISIDGVNVSDGSIIIDANSSSHLEGFIKGYIVKNKFKFIEKTEEISNHRGDRIDDGLIRIEYTFEAPQPQIIHDYHYHHDYHHYHDYWPYYPWYNVTYYNTPVNKSSDFEGKGSVSGSNPSSFSSVQCNDNIQAQNFCSVQDSPNDQGITVPGSHSYQQFQPGYVGTLETNSHVIIIRLVGGKADKRIEKPIFTKTKLTCPTCGRKSRSDSAYCKNCGTALS
jgi:hypothetical protein